MTSQRIRMYHAQSGSVLQGEVTKQYGEAPRRAFYVIPDGLLEQVSIREGVWHITELAPDA